MERISINTENFLLILHNKSRAIFTLLNEWREKKIIIRFLRNNFIDSRFLSCIREIIYRDPHSLPMNNLLTRISKQQHLRWSFFEQCFISIFFLSLLFICNTSLPITCLVVTKILLFPPCLLLYYCVVFSWKSSNSLIIRFP